VEAWVACWCNYDVTVIHVCCIIAYSLVWSGIIEYVVYPPHLSQHTPEDKGVPYSEQPELHLQGKEAKQKLYGFRVKGFLRVTSYILFWLQVWLQEAGGLTSHTKTSHLCVKLGPPLVASLAEYIQGYPLPKLGRSYPTHVALPTVWRKDRARCHNILLTTHN
jgi:hypothetical protein